LSLDPFSAWLRLGSAALDLAGTQLRAAKTVAAAGDVVRKRSDIIDAAVRSPLTADHAELARMVPEKVAAFAQAGSAMSAELVAMQFAWADEMQHLWRMAMKGRAPTAAEMGALADRGSAYALRTTERTARLAEAGLAPIRKQVSANARRLRKRKPA
jgi:hypothetical protein